MSIRRPFLALFLVLLLNDAFAIKARQRSDLQFGTLVQGDGMKVVPPGTSENAENASFEIQGRKNSTYTIILPASATLTSASGGSIVLSNFQSFPAEGANGQIDNSRTQDLFIGATLPALPFSQPPGAYTGNFVIDVIQN